MTRKMSLVPCIDFSKENELTLVVDQRLHLAVYLSIFPFVFLSIKFVPCHCQFLLNGYQLDMYKTFSCRKKQLESNRTAFVLNYCKECHRLLKYFNIYIFFSLSSSLEKIRFFIYFYVYYNFQ